MRRCGIEAASFSETGCRFLCFVLCRCGQWCGRGRERQRTRLRRRRDRRFAAALMAVGGAEWVAERGRCRGGRRRRAKSDEDRIVSSAILGQRRLRMRLMRMSSVVGWTADVAVARFFGGRGHENGSAAADSSAKQDIPWAEVRSHIQLHRQPPPLLSVYHGPSLPVVPALLHCRAGRGNARSVRLPRHKLFRRTAHLVAGCGYLTTKIVEDKWCGTSSKTRRGPARGHTCLSTTAVPAPKAAHVTDAAAFS